MTKETKNKLADIVDRVKDPENGMSVSEMNLVAGKNLIRQQMNLKFISMYTPATAKACCVVYQLSPYATVENLLKEEIENEFPHHTVVFKNP